LTIGCGDLDETEAKTGLTAPAASTMPRPAEKGLIIWLVRLGFQRMFLGGAGFGGTVKG